MAANSLPSIIELRQLLEYAPETGMFLWKARAPEHFPSDAWHSPEWLCASWNRNYAGKPTFTTPHSQGYLTGRIGGKPFYAHRVAWAIHHGAWPAKLIDHIDRNKANNRIGNLREATYSENARNTSRTFGNEKPGLTFRADRRVWRVRLRIDGIERTCGQFKDYADAVECWERHIGSAA